jgi:hypothetical protein
VRYNHGVNRSTYANPFIFLGLAITILLSTMHLPAHASQLTGYDLAAAVNAYRATNGYYTLNPHPQVMAAAQAHADWIVATGQGGHIGAGGSDETVRVSWTGYGGGAPIQCDENWGGGRTIEEVMSGAWSDWVHQEVMLNAWGNRYTDIGGGVAQRADGRYVFVLNVCKVIGQEADGEMPLNSPTGPGVSGSPPATSDRSNYIFGVVRATPLPDGSIIHRVQYGQSLAAIAAAYEMSVDELRELNGMAAGETLIRPEEELLVRAATRTEQTAPTAASAATPTVIATEPPARTATSPLPTPTEPGEETSALANPLWGVLLLVMAGGALVIFLWLSPVKK